MTALPHFLAQSQQYLLMPAGAGAFANEGPGRRAESLGFAALVLFFGLTVLSALLGA